MNKTPPDSAGSTGRSKTLQEAYEMLGTIRAMLADSRADLARSQVAITKREEQVNADLRRAHKSGDLLTVSKLEDELDTLQRSYELTVLDPERTADGQWPPYPEEKDVEPTSTVGREDDDGDAPAGPDRPPVEGV